MRVLLILYKQRNIRKDTLFLLLQSAQTKNIQERTKKLSVVNFPGKLHLCIINVVFDVSMWDVKDLLTVSEPEFADVCV